MIEATDRDTSLDATAPVPVPAEATTPPESTPEPAAADATTPAAAPAEAAAAPTASEPASAADVPDAAGLATIGVAEELVAAAPPPSRAAALADRLRALDTERYRRPATAAAALLLALGVGYGGGRLASRPAPMSVQPVADATSALRQSHDDASHLGAELKALKTAVDGMRAERDRARGELAARQAQLTDRTEKLGIDVTGRLGRLADQLDRMEKTQRDPARLGALAERLDRIEKHVQPGSPAQPAPVAQAPTPPPKPVAAADTITQTGSLPDPKPPAKAAAAETDPRKLPLDGYVLRDLDEGDYALVEARNGRIYEVAPGRMLPGVGRVEAIERRGRRWVVVTAKGYIAER